MIFQFDITGMEWILGVGIMFALALVMTMVTKKTPTAFLSWLLIFCGFVVASGLLPLWTLILCLIVLTVSIFFEFKPGSVGG